MACYAIVVETIDKLYYREHDNNQTGTMFKIVQEKSNKLKRRIITYYLQGTRISSNMVEMLQKYYRNEIEITADEIDTKKGVLIDGMEE